MEKEKLLDYVAPCSMLCYTCTAFKDGPVSECAMRLYTYYDGYCELASADMSEEEREEWHSKFNEFHNTLQHIGGGASCPGCRRDAASDLGCIPGCVIRACIKERGMDFCAECNEFPCQKAKDFFAAHNGKIDLSWESGSKRIREIGIDAYFKEKKNISHYILHKKKAE